MTAAPSTASIGERLTRQFYDWEKRGRGWDLYEFPVDLEPAFEPFTDHFFEQPSPAIDDGLRPGLWSHLTKTIGSLLASRPVPAQKVPPRQPPAFKADDLDWTTVGIGLPADAELDLEHFEQLLVTLGGSRGPVSFEVIGTAQGITLQMACDRSRMNHLTDHLAACFPEIVVSEQDDALHLAWEANQSPGLLTVDFGLSREFMLPLVGVSELPLDPYVSLIGALSHLQHGEMAAFQVLFEPVRNPWGRSISRAVTFSDGSPFFEDDKNFFDQAKAKIAKPLFAAVARLIVLSEEEERVWAIAESISASLDQVSTSTGNAIIPLANDGYDDDLHFLDVFRRQTRRTGMLLNSEELTSLVHLPAQEVRSAKLQRIQSHTKETPASVRGHSLVLGANLHHGRETPVTLSIDQRVRHMHVIGASGTGKSTFLLNLIVQDIQQGQGIGVIDPHGDLIDQIISHIPESRIKDVILVDPADEAFPVGFNILSAHSDLEKNLLASDLVAVFKRFSTSWGDQMGSVLSNAVLAFLESSKGGTLADLRRFLIEPAFRNEFLATVSDEHVLYYWKKEFPLLAGRPQAPLLTRLDTFLRPKPVRYMVSQKENRLDFASIMDLGKIFLAKLAQGAIGEENAALLGSLFVSKFHQLALGRQAQTEAARRPFWLYCDEFGSYVTPSMAKLLSGARKFRLGLVLSHQELHQLHDQDVQSALLSNAGTRVCFRVGEDDAKTLAQGFSFFEAEDLTNLKVGEALCRVGRSDADFNLNVAMPPKADVRLAESRQSAIVEHSRKTYGTSRIPTVPQPVVEAAKSEESAQKAAPVVLSPAATIPSVDVTSSGSASEPMPPIPLPPRPAPARKPRKAKTAPPVAPMGKGGQRHKYLQHLVSQCGQQQGWRATIEMPVKDGSIDVVLEREDRKLAVEISVTTSAKLELANLRKCLAAGFTHIFMLSEEPRSLAKLQRLAASELSAEVLAGIRFLPPDAFLADDQILAIARMPEEQLIRGLKVKVQREQSGTGDEMERRRAISEVILRSMRK